ncbi:sulfate ABC transporter substrate-binding protein [Saccharibacillus sp. CPCC 101409]|uniref:sulfate ABC transporter substrate-binding protein n=1 Tax=Saccharibacillus sp. CPCC 101409 TaxID=3058041 RepID=UPI0026733936|nr:sulfate ABC transporter substrate-binding protein [Saccharibacillus sp. CPCC 101409]MDO3412692.1 sulfate ABC transporter substrate-binding protein [Saccharibacillus sp. CPCC 101409]
MGLKRMNGMNGFKELNGLKKRALLSLTLLVAAAPLAACGSNASTTGAAADTQGASADASKPASVEITNVSYDPTRELYEAYNKIFQTHWKEKSGQDVTIVQSHGGSGKQARSVLEGNEADVVTLALEQDVAELEKGGLIEPGWVDEFDKQSSPYTSTIVFLVRKGNPKGIKDWDDIVKPGVEVITPNPKTSGGARWNFLAAWAYAQEHDGSDEAKSTEFIKNLYNNVTVLDTGARGATTTFVENKQGDVLLAWENEAFLSIKEHPDDYEIVTPSISILAQPSVAVVDEIAKKRGTEEVSKEYLQYLYSDEAQKLAGDNYYRPSNPDILSQFSDTFDLDLKLVNIDDDFGGWEAATEKFFADSAIFDQIYQK